LLRCTQGCPDHFPPLRESVAAVHAAQPLPLSAGHAAPTSDADADPPLRCVPSASRAGP
jgi:hypothetical protein